MVDELLSQDEIDALLGGVSLDDGDGGDAGLASEDREVLEEVGKVFSGALSDVTGMLTGKEVQTEVRTIEVVPQKDFAASFEGTQSFLYSLRCDGLDGAEAAVALSAQGTLLLADLMMGGDGKDLPEEVNDLYLSASQEGLSQVVGTAFTSISGLLKGQRFVPENASGKLQEEEWLPFADHPGEDAVWVAHLHSKVAEVGEMDFSFLMLSEGAAALAEKIRSILSPPKEEAPAPTAAPAASRQQQKASPPPSGAPASSASLPESPQPMTAAPVDVRSAEFSQFGAEGAPGVPSNLGLILDIPVRVTVELGRTRKTVGEILNLSPGSVVELDKLAGEPVDVLVNGKLVARGEVVVIDENFGIRVTEIVSRAERVKSVGM
ncbi:MAG TPA: flagellar motor switch phosphatase FliY [Synergistaceae bacterium]|nr:flagellar motor switch phosphatase FliY [Synergistaceae bacterium]HPQ38151.1 flagellar motor switch phosphatase FliY [Synergistaceae bacterium]